jgi:hypothetical protein
MDWWIWVLIVGIAVLLLVAFVAPALRRNRLRSRFGPEYDRTLEGTESRRDAEHDLRDRLKRRRQLELRQLAPEAARDYARRWEAVQAEFVDAPEQTCAEAETLLDEVLRARGYPVDEDFDEQADLVSVDHPTLVQDYRNAHEAYQAGTDGPTRTEDLRIAFVAYRGMFADLLDVDTEAVSDRDEDRPEEDRDEPGQRSDDQDEAGAEARRR